MIVEIAIIRAKQGHADELREGPLFPEWRSHFGHLVEGAPDVSHFEGIAGP
ncbi:MAG: hypothetical protein HY332_11540 [Chloroflexi bacterium]|nr:hypothetical protein [Chloroflexota bacterium]